jgi:hypothetical protein
VVLALLGARLSSGLGRHKFVFDTLIDESWQQRVQYKRVEMSC